MLQSDDVRRLSRQKFSLAVVQSWRREAIRGKLMAQQVQKGKVFKCWYLFKQEQVLLHKYLQECSNASFRNGGSRGSPPPGSVGLQDFEQLYTEMAAHRWDTFEHLFD